MAFAGTALLLLLAVAIGPVRAGVTIADNGYSGVLVGISQDVPQEQGQQLIDAVKVMFREASQALFTATDRRAYFKSVTILIPMSWTNFTIDRESFAEVYEGADVRLAPPNPAYGDNPYTLQPGGCGEPGKYIHVSPGYLQNLNTSSTRRFGPPGKVLTHEWAHLRYGVFEEYGYPGDDTYPMFYYTREANGESKVVPNTCSNTDLRGYKMDQKTQQPCTYSKTTGLPDNNCVFYPYDDNDAISSLMTFTYLDSVNHFCNNSDDKRHRPDAPNKQNFRCNQRSVWEVMRENADFKGGRNPPASLEPNQLVPTFEVVQPAQARFIMVLDTSGSMGDVSAASSRQTSKIQKLHSAATKWIKYELQNGTWVSIVTFTDTAVLRTDFKQIVDKTSREEIARHVPSSAFGGTCICNGVYLGLKTLKKAVGTGGVMVLMTDGGENPPCYNPDTKAMWDLTDLYDPVVAADVRVITMAFGTSADSRLEKFADISGGRTYFISETKASLQLDQAFQGCLTYQPDITVETEKNIVLFQQYFSGSSVTTFSSMFSIDPTTGRDVVFKLAFDDASAISTVKSVRLVSPTGATYTNVSYEPSENFGTLKLHLAEEGDWQFSVAFKGRSDDVVITVTSKSRSNGTLPLTTECWIGTIGQVTVTESTRLAVLGRVRQGNNAVLSATVVAHVTTPSASSGVQDLLLLDNGAAADAIRNDGIYSKYFTQFDGKGRYSVVCEVRNDGNAVINEGFSASAAMPNPNTDSSSWCCGSTSPIGNTRPTGNFTRTVSAGAFQVTNNARGGLLPPAQVTDLVMSERASDGAVVTWTAPGADLDQGIAYRYQFKWSTNATDLSPTQFDANGEEVNSSLVAPPETSGTMQNLTLPVPSNLDTVYLAMRTFDQQGHRSTVSNTAILYLGSVPSPPNDDGLSAGAIVGIVIAAVVLLAVAVVGALMVRRRRRVMTL